MIYVDIVSDTICPWCYIGKRRFERALVQAGRTDIAVAWRPFQLNPDMPPEGMTRDDYVRAKFGGGDRPARSIRRSPKAAARPASSSSSRASAEPQHGAVAPPGPLGRQARSPGRGRRRVVQGLLRAGPRHRRSDTLVECAVRAGIDAESTRSFLLSDDGRHEVVMRRTLRPASRHQRCALLHRQPKVRRLRRPAAIGLRRGLQPRRARRRDERSAVGRLTLPGRRIVRRRAHRRSGYRCLA